VVQLVEALRHKMEVLGWILGEVSGKFSSNLILLSVFSGSGIFYVFNSNEYQGTPALTADNNTLLVVPNVKVRMNAQLSIPLSTLHESFTFCWICTLQTLSALFVEIHNTFGQKSFLIFLKL
jgi:hypothetical protein